MHTPKHLSSMMSDSTIHPLKEKFGSHFVNSKQEKVSFEEGIEGYEAVGLYFSAAWCRPCIPFTSKLKSLTDEWNKNGKKLQIIHITNEEEENDFKEYFAKMTNFLAIPFNDERIRQIETKYEVDGIPCLIVFDQFGELVDPCGQVSINKYGQEAIENWID